MDHDLITIFIHFPLVKKNDSLSVLLLKEFLIALWSDMRRQTCRAFEKGFEEYVLYSSHNPDTLNLKHFKYTVWLGKILFAALDSMITYIWWICWMVSSFFFAMTEIFIFILLDAHRTPHQTHTLNFFHHYIALLLLLLEKLRFFPSLPSAAESPYFWRKKNFFFLFGLFRVDFDGADVHLKLYSFFIEPIFTMRALLCAHISYHFDNGLE